MGRDMVLFLFETKIISVTDDRHPLRTQHTAFQAELSPIFDFRAACYVRNATTALKKRKPLRIPGGETHQCGISQPQARALLSSSRHNARN
jgi:hypothetical protein